MAVSFCFSRFAEVCNLLFPPAFCGSWTNKLCARANLSINVVAGRKFEELSRRIGYSPCFLEENYLRDLPVLCRQWDRVQTSNSDDRGAFWLGKKFVGLKPWCDFRSSARFELVVDDYCLDGTVVAADNYWR
jgi:hypothetical protein